MIEKIQKISIDNELLIRVPNTDFFQTVDNLRRFHIYDLLFTTGVNIVILEVIHEGRIFRVPQNGIMSFYVASGRIMVRTSALGGRTEAYLEDFANRPVAVENPVATRSKVDYEALTNQILGDYPDKIRLERLLKKRKETVEEFIYKFFTEWNDDRNTIFVNREVQTLAEKRRSLGDIFMIVRYYYPSATLEEVVKILHETMPKRLTGFRTSYCNDIKKRVFYYDGERATGVFDAKKEDEYGNLYADY